MKQTALKLAIYCFAGILFLCCGERAQAGFVVPALDSGMANDATALGAGASAERENDQAEQFPQPATAERREQQDAFASPSSNMSSNGSVTSGGGPAPAVAFLADAPIASNGRLTAYLLAEPALLLPVPFLDGVFRPPRKG